MDGGRWVARDPKGRLADRMMTVWLRAVRLLCWPPVCKERADMGVPRNIACM